jgi:branched-chain amino acid aminotransferase, group I
VKKSQETTAAAEVPAHHDYWVFNDGRYCRYRDVRLGLMTHAFSYGTACFEGMRAYWSERDGDLYLLQAVPHFRRLLRSSRVLRMDLGYSVEDLIAHTREVVRRNDFRENTFIRPTAYKSSEEIGVRLTGVRDSLAILALPYGNYLPSDRGLRCMVSSWRRISDAALPARSKINGSYVNSALAKSEALDNGYDEAIVLGADGHVSEGSAENLFMIRDGVAITPPVTDDILEGVTRSAVIELLRDEVGVAVVERSIDRTELYACDELLLCGTAAQIVPVIEVDRRPVGDGVVGEITQTLQAAYFAAVRGEDAKRRHWLTSIYSS